jgi:hypothetical protein
VAGALGAAHQLGQLEAVHFRHVHVEQNQRHVVAEEQIERLRSGPRRQDLHVQRLEQRGEDEQVLVQVVDQEAGAPARARRQGGISHGGAP